MVLPTKHFQVTIQINEKIALKVLPKSAIKISRYSNCLGKVLIMILPPDLMNCAREYDVSS
jgi:hypothetical protein